VVPPHGEDSAMGTSLKLFKERLFFTGKLKAGVEYFVIVKIRMGNVYRNVGEKQEEFKFYSIEDASFERLFETINDKLNHLNEYPSDSSLDYSSFDSLLLEFYQVNVKDELKSYNLSKLKDKLARTEFDNTKKMFNYFGYSIFDIKGNPLEFNLDEKGLYIKGLKSLEGFKNFEEFFFSKLKSKHKDYILDIKSKLYLIEFKNRQFYYSIE
jgi:hypothetical protein